MKKLSFLLLLIFVGLLAACGASTNTPDAEEQTEPTAEPALEEAPGLDAEEEIIPRVTITPTPEREAAPEDAYPALVHPTATPYPDDYPVPEVKLPESPYPADGETVWALIPAGEQCAESLNYENEKEAQASLEAAGIDTYAVKTIDIPVMSVCGGATSTQYLVEIDAANAASAESLGWQALTADEANALEGE